MDKPKNQTKHLSVGFLFGFISMIALFNINLAYRACLGWLAIATWFIITCGWEYYQYLKGGMKPDYWSNRGLDTILDILAGNAPFILLALAGMYGQSIVGVMRP